MNKVDFTLKNGRIERMHPKIAELLQRKGKGTYQTTAVQESPQRAVLVPEPTPVIDTPVDPGFPEDAVDTPVDLASMSVDDLREHAKRQGVQVHHRAGTEKIIEALAKKAEE